jgi:exopolysaccharide production protein ExoY
VTVDCTADVAISRAGGSLKRVVDIFGSALLLVLASPLILLFAVMIRLHDGGPAFYRRRVIGPDGEFDAFKLRSMRVDADEVLRKDPELRQKFEVNYKLDDDPRVTRIGALLRKTNFDELPQLWNVFRGQMSLVGPRMITIPELQKYGSAAWIFQSVRPGLTGYWQIHGRNAVSYQRRVEMDLFYVKNWSILLDFKLLLQTSLKTFQGSLG